MAITNDLYQKYLKHRRDGVPARIALCQVKHVPVDPIDWDHNGRATVTRGRYRVELSQEVEQDADLSYLGEYSSRPGTDAIDREARHDAQRHEYQYWTPAISLAEHFKGFHEMGYDRNTAWRKALVAREQDYRHMEHYIGGAWCMLVVSAVAYWDDIECGSAVLGGVESDSGQYLDEVAHELIREALADAKANKKRLIKRKAQEIAALADVE